MQNSLGKAECLPSLHHAHPFPRKEKKIISKAAAEGFRRPWSGAEVSKEEEKEKKERRDKEEGKVESLCSFAG